VSPVDASLHSTASLNCNRFLNHPAFLDRRPPGPQAMTQAVNVISSSWRRLKTDVTFRVRPTSIDK